MTVTLSSHSETNQLHPHRHAEAYVALVLDGGYYETSADGTWFCEAGDVVVHPPHHLHGNSFKGSTEVLNLQIPNEWLALDSFRSYSVIRPGSIDELLRKNVDFRALQEELSDAKQVCALPPDDWVSSMASELAADPGVRVADLARKHSVTNEHASRAFRKRYCMTASAFRSESRFRRAQELLRETPHSLCEIAHLAGYSDQPHFCREFSKRAGLTPGKLRH